MNNDKKKLIAVSLLIVTTLLTALLVFGLQSGIKPNKQREVGLTSNQHSNEAKDSKEIDEEGIKVKDIGKEEPAVKQVVMEESEVNELVKEVDEKKAKIEELEEQIEKQAQVAASENNSIGSNQESSLQGKIICIDAGHQAKGNSSQEPVAPGSSQTKAKVSSGTRGVSTGKYEYELNLEVALKLKEALLEKGAIVYMVRESNDVDISNAARAKMANDLGADLSLRIHADGSENPNVNGFSLLVPGTKYVSEEYAAKSLEIAKALEMTLHEGIQNKNRGIVARDDLTGFNWCETSAVLLEMGFMSNGEEDERMSTEDFQYNLVSCIIEGLENYYK